MSFSLLLAFSLFASAEGSEWMGRLFFAGAGACWLSGTSMLGCTPGVSFTGASSSSADIRKKFK